MYFWDQTLSSQLENWILGFLEQFFEICGWRCVVYFMQFSLLFYQVFQVQWSVSRYLKGIVFLNVSGGVT